MYKEEQSGINNVYRIYLHFFVPTQGSIIQSSPFEGYLREISLSCSILFVTGFAKRVLYAQL